MPIHALVGHVVIITAAIASLLALVYAWRPRSRAGMRVPLVAATALNMALAVWAGSAGSALLDDLERAAGGEGALPPTVREHAHGSDALTLASLVLLTAVLALVWWLLSPRRTAGTGTVVASVVLTACALAVVWFGAATLVDGLQAVWDQHSTWRG